MSILFEEIGLNNLRLGNRFVRSATWEGLAGPEGQPGPAMTKLLADLAQGGVGLIITGHAFVSPQGRASQGQLGIHKDSLVPELDDLVEEIHKCGGRVAVQLAHSGLLALPELTGSPALGPSPKPGDEPGKSREMSRDEIAATAEAFGLAAARAKEAGFDAVQIHAAHGYLLSQFLSPFYNRRQDEYGGGVENRSRFLLEVVQEVRRVVGPDFPILAKMNCRDFVSGGLELEDSVRVGRSLEAAGLDGLEVSGGTFDSGKLGPARTGLKTEDKEAYFRKEAAAFKKALSIPVILVGGIRSLSLAESLVEQGNADLISMSRPFIRQPDLVEKWRKGETPKTTCISDNLCFVAGQRGKGIFCLSRERQNRKKNKK